jgi:nitroreductase
LMVMRRRRVTRFFTADTVEQAQMNRILDAARWAPSGGNRRLHRFVATRDMATIDLIRAFSPGMLGRPRALIVICIDWAKVAGLGCKPHHPGVHIDVGTATQNMLLAAEAIGLGAGPVTSFSREAVRVILDLPDFLSPEMIIALGIRAPAQPFPRTLPRTPTTLENLVLWQGEGTRAPVTDLAE